MTLEILYGIVSLLLAPMFGALLIRRVEPDTPDNVDYLMGSLLGAAAAVIWPLILVISLQVFFVFRLLQWLKQNSRKI